MCKRDSQSCNEFLHGRAFADVHSFPLADYPLTLYGRHGSCGQVSVCELQCAERLKADLLNPTHLKFDWMSSTIATASEASEQSGDENILVAQWFTQQKQQSWFTLHGQYGNHSY